MPFNFHSLLRDIRFGIIILVSIQLLVFPGISARSDSSEIPLETKAKMLLEHMTPEERVGQLFLVTFHGTDISSESIINNLITEHHVGGVVLLAKNDNFVYDDQAPEETTNQAHEMVSQLQQDVWDYSKKVQVKPGTGESYLPTYIPLFVAISQEGNGYPTDQILSGMTEQPNAMTLGATWNPELASDVGDIVGKEMNTLGFNILLGPSLDVLETPQLEVTNNLGTRTFGGDPYWVGEMGRAFIRGVHLGSEGRVAVVAKHFPGHGSSDRLPEEEVATVRKSLDELTSLDLAPFFAVTGDAKTLEETTDALLTSHIRYRGLQGNIRAATRPVSFDPQALSLLMAIPALSSWRDNGGVIVSDNLGSLAVRRYYELSTQTFDARRVTLNAFLSGNDILFIDDFSSTDNPDSYTAALLTLDFFVQKYQEDPAFAQRVDESVTRILALKNRIYQEFSIEKVLSDQEELGGLGQSDQVPFEVSRQAATLISPTQVELDEVIPDPPNRNERIIFFSETYTAQQCSTCPPYQFLDQWALQEAVLRLSGPQAGGQILASHLVSYSTNELQKFLDAEEENRTIDNDIKSADWIVFLLLRNNNQASSFQTLTQFLNERPDLFQRKRLILFALCAPYHLDATNISKLTAYFGLYNKTPQAIDIAAYLLFGELRASGASPVSIPGISYNLTEALFPDPNEVISLELDLPSPEIMIETTGTPSPTPPPQYGVILDHNGHPVPDGTPVNFIYTIGGDTNSTRQVLYTEAGIARTLYVINDSGALQIRVESENARSGILQVDIPSPSGEIATLPPTDTPTEIPSPTPSETPFQLAETPAPPSLPNPPGLLEWIIAVFISGITALFLYRIAIQIGQVRWGVRAGFLAFIGGLTSYTIMSLQMTNGGRFFGDSVLINVLLSTLLGGILGLLVILCWRLVLEAKHRRSSV